ncbi:MAG TPA: archaemetzincin family Zn-dependent metalloprotease [Candidatus Binatia bacterium]|nr:archaemetzincin family Zn-dependent metalloprotease [Candidatus Binatia bacterium]
MKVGILQFGQITPEVLTAVQKGLTKTFPDTSASVIKESLPVPQQALDRKRSQYNSAVILNELRLYTSKTSQFHGVLGLVDVDIFSFGLNYVFGKAYSPGNAALISLWRLKPEFYKDKPDIALYTLRAQKESVHEVGHILGVRHCSRSLCVMHFSNSIFDTDKKQTLLCDECYMQAAIAIVNLR